MIKYRTEYKSKITPVEVERETELCIWMNGRKTAKYSSHTNYYDTWGLAHVALLNAALYNLGIAHQNLQRAQDVVGNIKGMRKPADAAQ